MEKPRQVIEGNLEWREGKKKNKQNPFNQNQIPNLFNVFNIYLLHTMRATAEWGKGIIYCLFIMLTLMFEDFSGGHEKWREISWL